MPVYNVQAMADKVRYLEGMGLSKEQAEQKAFAELGVTGELPEGVKTQYNNLYTNPTTKSPFARNDKDNVLDRANAGARVEQDLSARPETNQADAT